MKFLGGLGCVCAMCGLVWGVAIRPFLWLTVVGMLLMILYCIFANEEE